MKARIIGLTMAALWAMAVPVQARDQIRIASSSTVYPFAATVAEHFGKTSGFKAPVIESTGSGGGLKLFCASVDQESPDIASASRRITDSEIKACAANGVTDIAEITIGYDGIVVANAKPGSRFELTRRELFLAIAKSVPVEGRLVPNPYRKWDEINPALPHEDIMVFGPAPNHGTRDVLDALVMEAACRSFPEIGRLDPKAEKQACEAMREDGAFIEVSENYTITLRKLLAEPRAVGILPFSYLDQNGDKIKAASLEGQVPSYDNIYTAKYPLSRPLYIYVKKAHLGVTAGIRQYLAEFTSEKAWGKDGYLAEKGLIALPDAERKIEAAKAAALPNLNF